ncbi:MAG TPA: GxxExxY protein [Candidatus Hydrogenedentes bacterium]|mgnify:CR=1 FL=1|nr:GxxExxY protein [Candidatus Hydrogenedentota bacterium]HRT22288.1 GxxExxY protein [Candidatus Hydrogenedentota bacterium]HRT67038.1 GxxExxY protein [Candidatus Hydrogenedentota bacterium]
MEFDALSNRVIGCAIEAHRELGPGLLESTYEKCLAYELSSHGITVATQVELPVRYKGVLLDCGYRIDVLVDDQIIIEVKSVDKVMPIHEAQLLTYLKLAKKRIGLLMNFNTVRLKDGISRFVL